MAFTWNTGSQTVTTTVYTNDTSELTNSVSSWKNTQADNTNPITTVGLKLLTLKADSLYGGTSSPSTILSDNTFTSSNMKWFVYCSSSAMELYIDGSATGETFTSVSNDETFTITQSGATITITRGIDSDTLSATMSDSGSQYFYMSGYAADGLKLQFLGAPSPSDSDTLLPPPIAMVNL